MLTRGSGGGEGAGGTTPRIAAATPLSALDLAALFEEAAGVKGLQVKRNEASGRLARALDNLTRVRDLLGELEPVVEPRTGAMLTPQGFIFISSPGSITPFHFDPEHNILLQLKGQKVMNVWPAGDERFAHRREHERYHTGGHRNLPWEEVYKDDAQQVPLGPGDAVLMPVMAPHFVANGDAPSISLSITWRSEWSYRESEAHAANAALRRVGLDPAMPPRWPSYAWAKTVGWRVARKLRLVS